MANLGFSVNVEKDAAEYREGFEVLAPGWYPVRIINEEVAKTKSGGGTMLIFTYELVNKPGKKIIDRLNIINASEKAQAIARATLAKIAESIGKKGELANTDVLFGLPFEVEIDIEEFESNTEPGKMLKSNKCKGYRAYGTGPKAPAPAAPVANKAW